MACRAPAQGTGTPGGVSLTIYSAQDAREALQSLERSLRGGRSHIDSASIPGFAIVREERSLALDQGRTVVRFPDVAATIEPTTVSFASLTHPGTTRVLEQGFEFDLVSTEKILEKFVDREITAESAVGDSVEYVRGKLLSSAGGIVLQTENGQIRILRTAQNFILPELPGGLITRPTLVWDVHAESGGEHRVAVGYEARSITWWADYNLVFRPDDRGQNGSLDLAAWVSILNRSGATFEDARLKLVAGDVNRIQEQPQMMEMRRSTLAAKQSFGGFEEKSFAEYHLYTLGRPATLPDSSTKQLELFPKAVGIPCEKLLVYSGQSAMGYYNSPMMDQNFGQTSPKDVAVYLRFRNRKPLGVPLPTGRIRVMQEDTDDGTLQLIGEDSIDHTPEGEEVRVRLGNAFDVVGERVQKEFSLDSRRQTMDETIEVRIRNSKEQAVSVIVSENLYRWSNWEITKSSHDFTKIDARTIHLPITVEAKGETVVRYSVHYSW